MVNFRSRSLAYLTRPAETYNSEGMATSVPPVRVDAVSAVVTALEVIVVLGTLKVLAYRFHGNRMAQAYLTLF